MAEFFYNGIGTLPHMKADGTELSPEEVVAWSAIQLINRMDHLAD